jgi:Phage gp6-like head-tail connector protein
MSAALLPLDKVKELLGITDTSSDARLTAALPVVTEYFENYCKRGLAYVADVVEEQALTARLPVFRYPIDTVGELLIDGAATTHPYTVDQARGYIILGYVCFWYPQRASVTYSGGYPQDEVPADLADAYARCCADYAGVKYTVGASTGGGAPLKALGLGSGALTVSFDTGAQAQSAYDTSAVPPLLAPYLFTLERYRMKDFV